tara:strand:+ start:1148 stop:1402 length:255 start_codon:yes stop_codon:yes gene_type:complete
MEKKTIDQKSTLWNNKMAITFIVSIILGTNAFNSYISDIYQNKEQIKYNSEANKRRLQNSIKKHELEQKIIFLKFKLNECNQAN